ncbi:MAG: polysaccharide biosynthesis/export family protein [Chitinophagaceae bacterium]|nr:polysaccharide biosynthesis/export family protein [Chitinophagaceae bacterium]
MMKSKQILSIIALGIFASCASPKRVVYFNTNEKVDSSVRIVNRLPRPDVTISADDILAINITSVDAFLQKDPVAIFNDGGIPYSLSATPGNAANVKGYLVNPDGNIDFPVLGKIQLSGLTPTEAKEKLQGILVAHIKAPVVEVRIVNYKINMMGEVGRVGPIIAPNHKINILEAITAAGDIPLTGRKDRVLLIRESAGKLEFSRINLNSKTLFTSPYYYLQKNDIVYVEPNRIKRQQSNEFLLFYLPTISMLVGSVLSIYGIVQLTKR